LYDGSTDGKVALQVDGETITFLVDRHPLFAVAQDEDGNALSAQRSLWFAWYGNHPDAVIGFGAP
jgi:hypothetical protein